MIVSGSKSSKIESFNKFKCGLKRNKIKKESDSHKTSLNIDDLLKIKSSFSLYDQIKPYITFQDYNDCGSQATIHHISQIDKIDYKLSILYQYYNARYIGLQKMCMDEKYICDEGSSLEENLQSIVLYKYIKDQYHNYEFHVNQRPHEITYNIAMANIIKHEGYSYLDFNCTQFKYLISVKQRSVVFGAKIILRT